MIRFATFIAVLAAIAAVVAGCSNNSSCTNCVTVSPCSTPAGMQASVVYPAPGSTGIPDNVAQIVIATNSTLPADWQSGSGWDVLLAYAYSGAYGNGHYGNPFATATPPFPQPTATPSFASPSYWSSTFTYSAAPNLPPGSYIAVELNDLNTNCYPGVTIGSFTSQ